MSEAPPPEAGNTNGEYLSQLNNSPAVIAHLQQLASQAAVQQHLQEQQQQPGIAPLMGHTMNANVIQYNQNPVPAHDVVAASGGLSTADLLRHVDIARQQQMVQESVAHLPATSAAQWSGNSLHDLVQRINVPAGLLHGGDLLQAHAGVQQQVNISDFVAQANAQANAQAYVNHEIPQQPYPAPDGASDPQAHGVPAPPDSSAPEASLPAVPPPMEAAPSMDANHHAEVVYHVAPTMDPLPPNAAEHAAVVADGSIVVLAAKILTESDVKHCRAILPRIAVENNLPFLLGFRTYGLILPDPEGSQWEFTIKSWANGRADRALSERRKDRRVYVVEQMSSYLAKHKLVVGDVIGFVVVNGHVQVHCQTPELRGWIDRPTYGAPQLSNPPINVPAKCSVLEDLPEEESAKRKCQRSDKCSKPDGHPGFCVGRQEGQRARNSHARLKLTFWPPPTSDHLVPHTDENLMEVEPSQLPSSGVFLSYVASVHSNVNTIELPRGSLLKVPVSCAHQRSLQITVTGPPGQQHVLIARALEDLVEGEDGLVPAAGRTLRWQLEGVAQLHAANFVEVGSQMCIERQGGGFAAQKLPLDAAPAPPGALNPSPTVAFEEFLCQRSQGCFKAVNHTGFCSGHRGVKRTHDEDGTGTTKKRKAESKRKSGTKAQRNAAAAAAAAQMAAGPPPPHGDVGAPWVPQPQDPNLMTQQMYAVAHAAQMAAVLPPDAGNPDVPQVPAPAKHGEVSDAADMLLALSGTHQQDGTVDPNTMEVKPQIPAPQGSMEIPQVAPQVPLQAQIPPPEAAAAVKQGGAQPPVSMGVAPDGKTMQEQVMALQGTHQVPIGHHMGEHEEDGSYLELLQSAVGSIHTSGPLPTYRDGIDPAHRPNM